MTVSGLLPAFYSQFFELVEISFFICIFFNSRELIQSSAAAHVFDAADLC